ncbi:type III-A CRISPR-associated RAMP protein Csm3, partial [Paratractidigestivibacter sp.]
MAYTKIKIQGTIEVKTGLHIGGDDSFSAIGAIDSPVVRDPLTRDPVIPGSTLKGKMRALLAREMGTV